MASKLKNRQRKVERREAKRKEKRRTLAKSRNLGLAESLKSAARYPVLDCCCTATMWDDGMGNVLLSRTLPDGRVAFAVFLVDLYCLGVKDAFGHIVTQGEYKDFHADLASRGQLDKLAPAECRELVEGAVEYAADLGLRPHADYRKVFPIFGDIDREDCDEEFVYGDNGKPHFIAGPSDSPQRCQQIVNTLNDTCGPNEYHFTMPMGGDAFRLDSGSDIVVESD